MYDVAIIGAGITGSMLAWKLSGYDVSVAVLEQENDIACGATMANSAIVHTGYDPEDGTLKAELNVKGARQYPAICEQLHCAYRQVGAYIAACGGEEEKRLTELAARADAREIPYRYLTREEALAEEPNLSEQVTRVLDFYTTAVIYPWEVADACMEVACRNGVELFLNTECESITRRADGYEVHAGGAVYETRVIVNAAGVQAEAVHAMLEKPGWHSAPRRGEYYVLDQDAQPVHHVIFPLPSKEFGKGVLAVPTVYGNTLIGPNSSFVEDGSDNGTSGEGLSYVRSNIAKTLKNIPLNRSIRTFAGIRPTTSVGDFIIGEVEGAPGFMDAASIESPGLASAPAIADRLIELISGRIPLTRRADASMERRAPVVMAELTPEERNRVIRENPAYGRIICRCEQISEGEIIDCMHRHAGAHSVKGVKKRVRPGMGRCQGGFCEPRVVELLARELGISPLDVVLDAQDSGILMGENRP